MANLTVKGVVPHGQTSMYGAGLRLMECLRLRVQDIDFSRVDMVCEARSMGCRGVYAGCINRRTGHWRKVENGLIRKRLEYGTKRDGNFLCRRIQSVFADLCGLYNYC